MVTLVGFVLLSVGKILLILNVIIGNINGLDKEYLKLDRKNTCSYKT